jgi:hypothetical protein
VRIFIENPSEISLGTAGKTSLAHQKSHLLVLRHWPIGDGVLCLVTLPHESLGSSGSLLDSVYSMINASSLLGLSISSSPSLFPLSLPISLSLCVSHDLSLFWTGERRKTQGGRKERIGEQKRKGEKKRKGKRRGFGSLSVFASHDFPLSRSLISSLVSLSVISRMRDRKKEEK